MSKAELSKKNSTKKKNNFWTHWKYPVLIMLLIVIVVASFVAGTSIGFSKSMEVLSGCKEVPCEQLGITNANVCELCTEPKVGTILKETCTVG